jgi:hypothetical protein
VTKSWQGPRAALDRETERRLDEVFEAARGDVATDSELQRLASRMSAVLPAGALAAPGAAPVSPSVAPAAVKGTAAPLLKLGAAVAIAGGVGLGLARWHAMSPEPVARPLPAEATVSPMAPAASMPADDNATSPSRAESAIDHVGGAHEKVGAAGPARHASRAKEPTKPPVATNPVDSNDREPTEANVAQAEHTLLLEARRRTESEPAAALALVDDHARRFPKSELRQERELIALDALIALGRFSEARARARSFRQMFPGSAHVRRLEALEARMAP